MMTVRQDLRIRQGETFSYAFTHRNADGSAADLGGLSARMAIRTDFGSSLEAFLSSKAEPKQGDIDLGAGGVITLSMSAAQTTELLDTLFSVLTMSEEVRKLSRYVTMPYDLELVSADGITVERALQGTAQIERGMTSQWL